MCMCCVCVCVNVHVRGSVEEEQFNSSLDHISTLYSEHGEHIQSCVHAILS